MAAMAATEPVPAAREGAAELAAAAQPILWIPIIAIATTAANAHPPLTSIQ